MQLRTISVLLVLCVAGSILPLRAQPSTAEAAVDQLLERERVRSVVSEALDLLAMPETDGDMKNDNLVRAADRIVAAGPAAAPFVANELQQHLLGTYFFSAYALGRLGGAEAEQALRREIERSDEEPGDFAELRKGWAGYGLALMGIAESVELMNTGRHHAGHLPLHAGMSIIEGAALQTAPDCIPLLLAQQARLAADEERWRERRFTLRALSRVADASTVETMVRIAAEPRSVFRKEIVPGLGRAGTPRAIETLISLLDDPASDVAAAAGQALERAQPVGQLDRLARRLEQETNTHVRASIYRTLARARGEAALPILQPYWGLGADADRVGMVEALGLIGTDRAIRLMSKALDDPSTRVHGRAALILGFVATPRAVDELLRGLESPTWTVVQNCMEQLVMLGEPRAAEPIAARLFDRQLAVVIREGSERYRAETLCQALVDLRHADPKSIKALRREAERQVDATLIATLQRAADQIETLRKAGVKTARWIETAASDLPDLRRLAYVRLGELGGPEATAALTAGFDHADRSERIAILNALAELGGEPTYALIERVLLDPEFDSIRMSDLRNAAAWGARKLGGDRMRRALRQSVERRGGRDAMVLAYLMLLAGKDELETVRSLQRSRMRYLKWTRGQELDFFERTMGQLERGRLDPWYDMPPTRLFLR